MKKTSYLVFAVALLIVFSAGLSQIYAQSRNPCSSCHGSYYQYLDVLEGDGANQIPAAINVGETKNLTVGIQNLSNAGLYTTMSGVSVTLTSQSGHFSVKTSTYNIGNFPVGKRTATWQITGLSAGTDNLVITAQGTNIHQSLSFSDAYAPSPSITVAQPSPDMPIITLSSPIGGEMWLVGSRHNITWTTSGGTGTLNIRLDHSPSGTNGSWTNIANNEPNDGAFAWTVPNSTSTNSYVRATVSDSAVPPHSASSMNTAPFTITTKLVPMISLTNPASGIVWSGGSVQTITWISNGKDIGNCRVTLSYSTDDFDESNQAIASLVPDTGSYSWTLPFINSGSIQIRAVIRDPSGQTSQDISEPFRIDSTAPTVVSVSPSDGLENVTSETLSITFSEPVSTSSAEQAFSIYPETNGRSWSWDSQQQTMTTTNVLFFPNTAYTVTIAAGVTDLSDPGNTNGKVFSWSFTTGFTIGPTIAKSSQPPVIILEIQEPQILANEPATFNASKTFDPDNSTLVFSWDFGDNTTVMVGSNPVEVHSFVADGRYKVLLKASDGNVQSVQAMEIFVRKPQAAANATSSFDWHLVWGGLLISIVGMIGVGRSAFLRTESLTMTAEQATRTALSINSVLPTLLLRTENCVGCGFCAKKCPVNAITIADKRPLHDPSKCRGCMECANKCPRGSITIIPAKTTSPVQAHSSPTDGNHSFMPRVHNGNTKSMQAKESFMLPTLLLREENCVGCGLCSKKCPNNAITMINKRPAHDPSKCRACMECVKWCARGSITINSAVAQVAPVASLGR